MLNQTRAAALALAVAAVHVASCSGGSGGIVGCADSTVCALAAGGQCLPAPVGFDVCAYPDAECTSGFSWSPQAGDLAGECVSTGADASTPDAAPGQTAFDIGYVSSWLVGSDAISMSVNRWVRVVNMGTEPLDLSTARVVNVVSNASTVPVDATWGTITTVLSPGRSSGALSSSASALIVGGGFVNEPAENTTDEVITFSATFPPQWGYVDVEITVEIGNARSTFPITLREGTSRTGMTYAPETAQRAVSAPL